MTGPTSISAVPLDYFMNGVQPEPQNGQQPAAPVPDGRDAPSGAPAGQPRAAGGLIGKLDVLLTQAAKASTKSLDGKTVKSALQKLVDDGALDKKSLKLLARTADRAKDALKALNAFTGRDLAAAFGADDRINAESPAGKAVLDAIKAQNDLSEMLSNLDKGLDSIARHADQMLARNRKFRGVDEALQNEVAEMRLLCDRRATEISRLAYQMKAFALNQAAQGENADPNVTAILNAKVKELLPREALAMHGTADALSRLNENVTAQLRPLAQRIESFRLDPAATLDGEALTALANDISTMKAALASIRENGIDAGGSIVRVPRDIIQGMEKELARVEARLSTACKDVQSRICSGYQKTAKELLTADSRTEEISARFFPERKAFLDSRNEFLGNMNYLIGSALDPGTSDQKLGALIADFVKKSQTMQAAARKVLDSKEKIPPEFKAIVKRAKNSAPLVAGLISIIRTMRSSERLLTGSEAMSLFKGAVTVSSVVESRVRGLDEADVDPANEDANIVSSSQFGQGNGGKVYLLKRTDGTEVIFKGETESRTGLAGLSAANGKAYGNEQQTVNLNIAARKAAEALGMGEMIVKYTAGTHKGVFGFFMDKAKGRPAGTFAKQADQAPTPEAGLSASEIAALPPEQKRRIKAGLQRELNRLQWLDLMTGQMDRHGGNYFVHIDRDTHKVTVTGIDNDAGYSQMRTGAVTFKLDADRTAKFKLNLGTIAKTLGHPTGGKDGPNPLMKEPGITVRQDGGITVDGSKIQNRSIAAALRRTLGAQTIVVPDKIDRQTYEALMALKSDPARKAYLDSIRPRLNEECYQAAVSRLDDTIAQAERLGREGKIIENEPDGWLDVQEPERRTDEIFLENKNGQMQGLGESVSFKANITMCPSYFSRDKLGEMFA